MTKHGVPARIVLPTPDPAPWEPPAPAPPGMIACIVCGRPFKPAEPTAPACTPACRREVARRMTQRRS